MAWGGWRDLEAYGDVEAETVTLAGWKRLQEAPLTPRPAKPTSRPTEEQEQAEQWRREMDTRRDAQMRQEWRRQNRAWCPPGRVRVIRRRN
jgi:hypothetical protein